MSLNGQRHTPARDWPMPRQVAVGQLGRTVDDDLERRMQALEDSMVDVRLLAGRALRAAERLALARSSAPPPPAPGL